MEVLLRRPVHCDGHESLPPPLDVLLDVNEAKERRTTLQWEIPKLVMILFNFHLLNFKGVSIFAKTKEKKWKAN